MMFFLCPYGSFWGPRCTILVHFPYSSRLLTFAHGLVSGLGPQKGDESRPNNTFLLRSETSKSTWPVDVEFVPFEVVVYGNP